MIAANSIFCGAAPFVGNLMQFNQKRREFITLLGRRRALAAWAQQSENPRAIRGRPSPERNRVRPSDPSSY
jgi:hypothetical protein